MLRIDKLLYLSDCISIHLPLHGSVILKSYDSCVVRSLNLIIANFFLCGVILMNEQEAYEFDRQGYIIIRDILDSDQIMALAKSIDLLEEHALVHVESPPRKKSAWGTEYHVSEEKGYHVQGERAEGKTLIIEDFWNSDSKFDFLVSVFPSDFLVFLLFTVTSITSTLPSFLLSISDNSFSFNSLTS